MENAVYNELRTRGFNVDVGVVSARKAVEDGTRKLISYEVVTEDCTVKRN